MRGSFINTGVKYIEARDREKYFPVSSLRDTTTRNGAYNNCIKYSNRPQDGTEMPHSIIHILQLAAVPDE